MWKKGRLARTWAHKGAGWGCRPCRHNKHHKVKRFTKGNAWLHGDCTSQSTHKAIYKHWPLFLLTNLSLGGNQHAHRLVSGTQHSIYAQPLWFTDIFRSLTKISLSLEGGSLTPTIRFIWVVMYFQAKHLIWQSFLGFINLTHICWTPIMMVKLYAKKTHHRSSSSFQGVLVVTVGTCMHSKKYSLNEGKERGGGGGGKKVPADRVLMSPLYVRPHSSLYGWHTSAVWACCLGTLT